MTHIDRCASCGQARGRHTQPGTKSLSEKCNGFVGLPPVPRDTATILGIPLWGHCTSCGNMVPVKDHPPYDRHAPGCKLVAEWLAPASELLIRRARQIDHDQDGDCKELVARSGYGSNIICCGSSVCGWASIEADPEEPLNKDDCPFSHLECGKCRFWRGRCTHTWATEIDPESSGATLVGKGLPSDPSGSISGADLIEVLRRDANQWARAWGIGIEKTVPWQAAEEIERLRQEATEETGCDCGHTHKGCQVNESLITERDSARALSRILAHCYKSDNRPPPHVVKEALAFPVIPKGTPDGESNDGT